MTGLQVISSGQFHAAVKCWGRFYAGEGFNAIYTLVYDCLYLSFTLKMMGVLLC